MKKSLTIGEPMALFAANEEGKLETVTSFNMLSAGADLNVAIGLSRLGHDVGFYSKLGLDPFAKFIIKILKDNNIDTNLINFSKRKLTGFMMKSLISNDDPDIYYYRKNSAASTMDEDDIINLKLDDYDSVHITGITCALSDSSRRAIDEVISIAKEREMLISFDPNIRPQLWDDLNFMKKYLNNLAFKSDIVMPGLEEGRLLTGLKTEEEIADFYLNSGTKNVIIKLGPTGAYYKTLNSSGYVKGFNVEKVIDTVGAGDGFAVGVISAFKEGKSIEEVVKRACAIGAIQVMSRGDNDGLPTIEKLNDFMNN